MATYYYAEGGGAANKEAATGGAYPAGCMSPATAVSESAGFSAGDRCLASDEGGIIRATITPGVSGSAGSHIVWGAKSGDSPHIKGSDLITTWSGEGTEFIWEAACTTDPVDQVWMDDTWGDEKDGVGSLVNEYDWYWAANVLYVYAATDPDARYTSPGVEAGARNNCFNLTDLSYTTVQDLECSQTLGSPVLAHSNSAQHTDISLIRIVSHDASKENNGQTIYFDSVNNGLISECEVYNSGWNGIAITCNWGIYDQSGTVAEKCYIHDIPDHNGFDIHIRNNAGSLSDITVKHCRIEDVGSGEGIFVYNENSNADTITDVKIYGNVSVTNSGSGLAAYTTTGVRPSGLKVYNNTFYGNGNYGIWAVVNDSDFQNNIVAENDHTFQMGIRDEGGTANTADYNLVWSTVGGDVCDWNNNACTHAELFAIYGQDEHGLSENPDLTNTGSDDYTLSIVSPCRGAADNLGSSYDEALLPASVWAAAVVTGSQDDY